MGVAVNPDRTKIYVTNQNDNTISVMDAGTNTVTATVKVGEGPFGVAVSPDGTKVYSVNNIDNDVSVIDSSTNTVTATIPVGNMPMYIAFGQSDCRPYPYYPNACYVVIANGFAV